MFSCFLLELQEMVSIVSQNMEPLSLQHLEAYVMLGLRWTCLRYDIFFLMVETEESISETDNDHILQEAFELWSCN